MQDPDNLRKLAAQCRALAASARDELSVKHLTRMADEYEALAVKYETVRPPGGPQTA